MKKAISKCSLSSHPSRRLLSCQIALAIFAVPLGCNFAMAQSTTDLYQATLSAIQAYGYAPPSLSNSGSPPRYWSMQSFNGGTLTATPMVISQSGQGAPAATWLSSLYFHQCPNANTFII